MILRVSGWTQAYTKSQNPNIGKAEEKGALRWRVCKQEGSVAGSPETLAPSRRAYIPGKFCK